MPILPINNEVDTEGVVTFTILIDGEALSGEIQVKNLTVYNAVNRIATADIVILDGNAALQDFEVSSSDTFLPGKKITLQAGYNSEDETIFEGVITAQKISVIDESTQLHVQCKSAAYPMTMARKSNIFYDITDSDIIEELISKYGLDSDVLSMTKNYSVLVQHRATDWDFIMTRAQLNACVCYEQNNTLTVEKPDLSKSPVQELSFGNNIFDIQLEMDARHQFNDYKAKTWNYSDQEITESEPTGGSISEPGNFSSTELAEANDESNLELFQGGSVETEFASNWISAKKQWQEMAKIRGAITVQGNHLYAPAEIVALAGVSDRFNGNHFISGVSHSIESGNWKTNLSVGIDPRWFMEQFDNISELPASAMIPSISGLQVGLVTALEGDPEGEQRIQVQLPTVLAASDGVWARVLSPYAGEGMGIQFMPEIGSEVLLGFLNDDPNQAIVLGGLFSNKNVAPQAFDDDNHIKTIVSRSEIKIEIDDDKKIIKIETPNGNIITADDDGGQIMLEDENGNKVLMSSNGIELNSASDIIISASGDVKISGTNIENAANAQYTAEGGAGIELSSSATAVLKGSLVQIN